MPKQHKKKHLHHHSVDEVATIVLAGGLGTRLYPLTKTRCKPAVHFGGQYRLIDIPISNSLNAGIPHIFIISQYLAAFLNNHIKDTFPLDGLQGGWIELLHPQETETEKVWYEGTADAVRKNLEVLKETPSEYFLILSGDQLYNMDLEELIEFAKAKDADLTIASIPIQQAEVSRMGLLQIDAHFCVRDFAEKPQEASMIQRFQLDPTVITGYSLAGPTYLASMGIYIFKRDALFSLLQEDKRVDFGQHLIPTQIRRGKTCAYIYHGYWEDIGTVLSYFNANLALTRNHLGLNLYDETNPIISQRLHLPSARIVNGFIKDSIICQGCVIDGVHVENSVIGPRTRIGDKTCIKNSIIMGQQFYEVPSVMKEQLPENLIIGNNCVIENAIIDENVSIGNGVSLTNARKLQEYDSESIVIRDGILIVCSGAKIPDGFAL